MRNITDALNLLAMWATQNANHCREWEILRSNLATALQNAGLEVEDDLRGHFPEFNLSIRVRDGDKYRLSWDKRVSVNGNLVDKPGFEPNMVTAIAACEGAANVILEEQHAVLSRLRGAIEAMK